MENDEKTQLDNLKEHLRVIAGNIRDESEKLSVILNERDNALKVIKESNDSVELNRVELSNLSVKIRDANEKLVLLNNEINEKIISIKNNIFKEVEIIQNDLIALKDHKSGLEFIINYYNETIKENQEEFEKTSAILKKTRDELHEVESSIVSAKKDLIKIDSIIEEKNDVVFELDKKIKQLEEYHKTSIEKITLDIEKEKEKILGPMKLLAITNLEVKRKEKNINILQKRLLKNLSKIYPDREFKL